MARVDRDLQKFVEQALAHGASRPELQAVLQATGWSQEQIDHALGAYGEVAFALPVPKPKPSTSAQEAFLYLVLFTTLLLSAYNLGAVVFEFIERAFPDPAASGFDDEWHIERLRWSVSTLIVAFPVFALVSHLIGRGIRRDPIKRASGIRRWLTYATLFVAAAVLIADVTTLVYNVLGGELTVRFVLKVVTVALIAGVVFAYYLYDLRKEEKEP
ncbi:MAG: hypothetical protein JRE81_06010 [Deltaproteobacteria bacterium]|jgi:hypothetical protein|nr:hypothetical protein [Deltaproteobacteria bacterium]